MNSPDWQLHKGTEAVSQLTPEYRLEYTQGTPSLVFMDEPGTHVFVLEYRSKNWIVDTSGSATSSLWTAETQRTQLDEHLFYQHLKWRWLRAKGADYGHEYAVATNLLSVEKARDSGAQKLSLGGTVMRDF